ncbi:urotensin 2 domain containing [Alosa sapidissima]|uniref:urotensin 2 domain containing n=1 Tax=Alosa sapidissima TaxID=34773 RepID=UPI001C083C0F|nr:urotensin 2 domain containing [Alosa sapidissima]
MDRVISVNLLLGVLVILPLFGVVRVQARSLLTPGLGNQILPHENKADIQQKILALLLQKTLEPIDKNALEFELLGIEEDLEKLQRQIISRADGKEHSKREEACFWKYCV